MKTTTDSTLGKVEPAGTNTALSLAGLVAEHPFLQGMTPDETHGRRGHPAAAIRAEVSGRIADCRPRLI